MVGTDIIEVARIEKLIKEKGDKFLNRIYTQKEIDYCESKGSNKYQHYAGRFAAKEAVYKAVADLILHGSLKLKDIEIVDSQNQLDLLNQQLEIFTVKKTNMEEKEDNLKSLAKTYEAMKLKDMASILKNVDDNTVMRIYFEMKPKKRQNLLLALDNKRAANITRKLAVMEQS